MEMGHLLGDKDASLLGVDGLRIAIAAGRATGREGCRLNATAAVGRNLHVATRIGGDDATTADILSTERASRRTLTLERISVAIERSHGRIGISVAVERGHGRIGISVAADGRTIIRQSGRLVLISTHHSRSRSGSGSSELGVQELAAIGTLATRRIADALVAAMLNIFADVEDVISVRAANLKDISEADTCQRRTPKINRDRNTYLWAALLAEARAPCSMMLPVDWLMAG